MTHTLYVYTESARGKRRIGYINTVDIPEGRLLQLIYYGFDKNKKQRISFVRKSLLILFCFENNKVETECTESAVQNVFIVGTQWVQRFSKIPSGAFRSICRRKKKKKKETVISTIIIIITLKCSTVVRVAWLKNNCINILISLHCNQHGKKMFSYTR